ncbi:hypothetical protein E3N88_10216 [Mikania micrantha]|uniref:Retrotransposon Copia-like N-terminal domain-containing protein n=1 Tax=Mikania micrantha TaxID=192012 RepID=A0A5N6PA15_9ASTR|nr:hypothetical protein E3N88_10216 [Mikania micrantha]
MSHENNSSFALKSILEKDKLNNTNFLEWHRNLKIVLKFAKKHYVLKGPVPNEPEGNTAASKNIEDMGAFDMIQQLTGMFQKEARQERYDTMKQLIGCKMQEGSSVSAHVLTMKGYIDQLSKLGYPLSNEMAADFILNSLPKSYDQFVMNFNMNAWEKIVPELHGMLKTAEMNVPSKVNQVLTVRSAGIRKPNPKKQGYNSKGKNKAIGFPIETDSNRGDTKVREERLSEDRTPRAMNRTWTARKAQISKGLTLECLGTK